MSLNLVAPWRPVDRAGRIDIAGFYAKVTQGHSQVGEAQLE